MLDWLTIKSNSVAHIFFCYALFPSNLRKTKYYSFRFHKSIVLHYFIGMKPLHSTLKYSINIQQLASAPIFFLVLSSIEIMRKSSATNLLK